jgi:hypothetical protein
LIFLKTLLKYQAEFFVKDFYLQAISKYFSNVTSELVRDKHGVYHASASVISNTTFVRKNARFVLEQAPDENYKCDLKLIDRKFDACKLNGILMRGFAVNWIYEGFRDKVNFEFKCPYKPGFYELKDALYNVASIGSFKLFNAYYCGRIEIFGMTGTKKKFEKTLSMGLRINVRV